MICPICKLDCGDRLFAHGPEQCRDELAREVARLTALVGVVQREMDRVGSCGETGCGKSHRRNEGDAMTIIDEFLRKIEEYEPSSITQDMARELLALRAQVRRYEEALKQIGGDIRDFEGASAYREMKGIALLALARATRTPDAGRAEPQRLAGKTSEGIDPRVNDEGRAAPSARTSTPGGGSEEPGTSPREGAPDEAERAAKVWLETVHADEYRVQSLAALLRTQRAAAREAGRVEGWDEVVKAVREMRINEMYSVGDWLAARRPGGGA